MIPFLRFGKLFTMNDITFSSSDLDQFGDLLIPGAVLGGFSIEDSDGNLIIPSQTRTVDGVKAHLSKFESINSWKVRFFRGDPGQNTSGGITEQEAIVYALIFG